MITFRVTLNVKIGLLIMILSAAAFIWTYFMPLRSMELFIPRISLGLMGFGGFLIMLKDFLESAEKIFEPSREKILPYLIGVPAAMWLYGWSFRNIGLLTSTFLFLTIWWVSISIRDAKRTETMQSVTPKILKLAALAFLITASVQLLFIELLNMYMPRTFLP